MPLTKEQRIANLAKGRATQAAKKSAPAIAIAEEVKEVSQQSQAIRARWAAEAENEQLLEAYFQDVEIDEGLALIARMRKNQDMAAKIINTRITSGAEENKAKCATCGGSKKGRDWCLRRPYRDQTTLLIQTKYFCSVVCVALENQKTQGVAAVSDRGLVKDKDGNVSVTG